MSPLTAAGLALLTGFVLGSIPTGYLVGRSRGIDIRKVVQTNIAPIIDTAIAHKDPGYPIIGAGLVRPPMECFKQALIAFGRKYHAN